MLRLLKLEWNKIYYYRAAKIFTLFYFAMLIIIGLIMANIKPDIGGVKLNLAKMGIFDFPVVWQSISYLIAIAKIFLAVIIITNITNEYSKRTLKQNLIDGLSKKEFLSSKVLSSVLLAVISTLFVFGIALTLGLIFSSSKENIFTGIEYIGNYFLKLNLFFSLCIFLSFLLRKTAFAFLGFIILYIVEYVILMAEFGVKAFAAGGIEKVEPNSFFISGYLPLKVSANLIEFPVDFNGFVMGGTPFKYHSPDWTLSVAAVIYSVIFILLSYMLLKRRDL